jgi:hypothetical protein
METCEYCNKSFKRVSSHINRCPVYKEHKEREENEIKTRNNKIYAHKDTDSVNTRVYTTRSAIDARIKELCMYDITEKISEKLNLFVDIIIYEHENKESVKKNHVCSIACYANYEDIVNDKLRLPSTLNELKKRKNCEGIVHSTYKMSYPIVEFLEERFSMLIEADYHSEFVSFPESDDPNELDGLVFKSTSNFYDYDKTKYNWKYTRFFLKKSFYEKPNEYVDIYELAEYLYCVLDSYLYIDPKYKATDPI